MKQTYIQYMGKYFGYPDCCIKEFEAMIPVFMRPKVVQEANSTVQDCGFVPCEKCAKRVVSGEITLNELITKRICPTPFPYHDQDKSLKYADMYKG